MKPMSKNAKIIAAERKRNNDAARKREKRAAATRQATAPANRSPVTLVPKGTLPQLTEKATHPGPEALFPPTTTPKYLTMAGLVELFKAANALSLESLPPSVAGALQMAKALAKDKPGVEGVPDSHQSLYKVLKEALDQASQGKGQERHANGLPYEEQPMQVISGLLHSSEGLAWQVIKKTQEAHGILSRARASGDPEQIAKAKAFHRKELLGAINYLAGALIFEERN